MFLLYFALLIAMYLFPVVDYLLNAQLVVVRKEDVVGLVRRRSAIVQYVRVVIGAICGAFGKERAYFGLQWLFVHTGRCVVATIIFDHMKLKKRLDLVQNVFTALTKGLLIIKGQKHHRTVGRVRIVRVCRRVGCVRSACGRWPICFVLFRRGQSGGWGCRRANCSVIIAKEVHEQRWSDESIGNASASYRFGKLVQQAYPNEIDAQRNQVEADCDRRTSVEDKRRKQKSLSETIQTNAVGNGAKMTHAFVSEYAMNGYVRRVFVYVQLVVAEKALQELEQHEWTWRFVHIARLAQRAVPVVVLLAVLGAFAQIARVLERVRVAQTVRLVH